MHYIYGDMAVLSYISIDAVLRCSTSFANRFFTMSGIKFDGNFIAENAFVFNSANTGSINNCHFRNFKDTCINSVNLGVVIESCSFIDTNMYYDSALDFSMTGIKATTDNVISNCKFFGCKYGIKVNGTSQISGCYMFGNCKGFRTNYGIFPNTENTLHNMQITNCEFDTIRYCFSSIEQSFITNCTFLWDNGITSDINSIFYATRALIASEISITNCEFYTPPNSTETEYIIKTFCSNNDFPNIYITGYHSSLCTKRVRKTVDSTHQFNITIGCTRGKIAGTLNADAVLLECDNNYLGTVTNRQVLKNDLNGLTLVLASNRNNDKCCYLTPAIAIANPIVVFNSNKSAIYIRSDVETWAEINLNGPAFNMHTETVQMPTLDYSVNAQQIQLA